MASGSSVVWAARDQFIPVSYSTSRRRDRFFRLKLKAAYVAISNDVYLLPRKESSASDAVAPNSFADFRGSFRFDISRGETVVETCADENPCALRITTQASASATMRARLVSIKIICDSEQQMRELSGVINTAAMALSSLQTEVLTKRRQAGPDLKELRALLARFHSSVPAASDHSPHQSPGLTSIVTQMTQFSQLSKGTARAFNGASEWAQAVGEAVADTRGAVTVLEKVFSTIPIAAPIAQVLGLAVDIAVLTVDRSEREQEMKELVLRCQAIAKDVVQALFFCLDYASVEDGVVERLFLVLSKCCATARLAEQFVMRTISLQFLTIEDVVGLSRDVHEIEAHVTSLRILQYVQENHARNQRADEMVSNAIEIKRGDSFRRALVVSPASVSAAMNFEESSESPESRLMAKLFDERCTSGLVGAVGMTGIGKSTILKSIANEPAVRRYFDGGIYELCVGNGCNVDEVKSELAKVVRKSGGVLTADGILACDSLPHAVDLAKDWFFGHRCLFIWDDVQSTSDAPCGYVRELRLIVDLIVGSRAIFSTRDRLLMNRTANPSDVICVSPRSLSVSESIVCRCANISASALHHLRATTPSSSLLNAFEQLVAECDGLPIYLAVLGRTIALKQGNDEADPLHPFQIMMADKREMGNLREEALQTTSVDSYAGFECTLSGDWQSLVDEGLGVAAPEGLDLQRMHAGLCVIEKETWVSSSIARRIWDATERDSIAVISILERFSFLESRQEGSEHHIRLQGLIHAFCKKHAMSDLERPLRSWHAALLSSYMPAAKGGRRHWWSCEEVGHGYLRNNLIRHLVQGTFFAELAHLLLDFRWIQRCVHFEKRELELELGRLERDYSFLHDFVKDLSVVEDDIYMSPLVKVGIKELRFALCLISYAIKLSRSTIIKDPAEISFQICGRLHHVEHLEPIAFFCESADKYEMNPMIRSIRPSLTLAGGAMQQSINVEWTVLAVAYIPLTDLVLVGGQGGAIVIDLRTAGIVNVLCSSDKGRAAVRSVAVNEKGSRAVCGWTNGTANLLNVQCSKSDAIAINVFVGDVVVAITADGKHVITGSEDGVVRLWDINSGEAVGTPFEGHSKSVTCVAVGTEPRWIASGSADHTIRIWDRTRVVSPKVIVLANRWIRCIAWTPGMDHLVAGTEQNDIWTCDVHSEKPCKVIQARNWINSIRVSSDGQCIFSGSHDGSVQMWDFSTGIPIGEPLRGHTGIVTSVTIKSTADHIVSGSYDGTIKEWRLQPNCKEACGHNRRVNCLAVNSDRSILASGSYDRTTRLWDMASGKALHQKALQGSNRPVFSVVFSPNGTQVASGFGDGAVVVHSTASGEQIHEHLAGHRSAVRCLCFDQNGGMLASGSDDKTVMIWNCYSGDPICGPLKGHRNWVASLCFSMNAALIASGSYDRTVRLWDLKSGGCIGEPLVTSGIVRSVKFSENDSKLEVERQGSKGPEIWILKTDTPPEKVLEENEVCEIHKNQSADLSIKNESSLVMGPNFNVLAHFDYKASSQAIYDEKRGRLWVGLCNGTVAAVELKKPRALQLSDGEVSSDPLLISLQ